MTKPRDPEALLSAYLVEGMEVLPDRVVDAVLAEIHRTRQRAVFGPWTTRSMFKPSLAVAAVVAVLVVGALLTTRRDQPVISNPSPSLPGLVAPSQIPSATAPNPSASPQTTGVWIPTGSMGTPRSGHDAVRLLDGRVLVVGGADGVENDTSAELYDPTSGTWSATGSMLKPRGEFGATLLRDGTVLMGDIDDPDADNPVMGAELYDPATGIWSATGKTIIGGLATATLLLDGKVLVRGDEGSELYDPDSRTWTATRSRPEQRHSHAAILLADGTVLVAGGHVTGDDATDTAELYDPDTGSWTTIASMHAKRENIEALLLPDGKVLVVGSSRADRQSAELYDPATGAWAATGDLAKPGASYEAITLLADGTVLATGTVGSRADPSAALYDPDTRSWTTTGSTLGRHEGAPTTQLLDGTVLMAGGGTDAAELYVPAGVSPPAGLPAAPQPTGRQLAGALIATGSMGTPREGHTAVRLLDGRVLVAGGSNEGESDMTSAELFDPESGTWSPTGNMLKAYGGFAATLLHDGRVLVGDKDDDPSGNDPKIGAEVYDPDSGTWTATGRMVFRKECCLTPTLLGDGRVLVTGREGNQLFDPDSGTWTATGKMITRGLGGGEAVLLPDGKVLMPGGTIYPRMFESAELYDPVTGSWTAIADMNAPHDGPTVTLLRDGTVLVAGRSPSAAFPPISAELYDPASGTWTVTGAMLSLDSDDRSATLLLDGTVLVIGSERDPELYDPGTRSWIPFWTTLGPHGSAPATLLLDGRVLLAGGDGCSPAGECGATRSAELYDPGAVPTSAPPPPLARPPTPTPPPPTPEAGPDGRPWKIRVSNNSSQPARLFVAEENQQGPQGRLVGSATPDVVRPGTTVEVTFLVPATDVGGWSIYVDTGPETVELVGWTGVPPPCFIHINEQGGVGWTCEG